jgi:hypothetical protein
MGASASFHPNQQSLSVGCMKQQLPAIKLSAQHAFSSRVEPNDVKGGFAQIDTECRNLHD